MFEDVDPALQREIRYRDVIKELERLIHDRTPSLLPKPKPLHHNEVVRLARMLAACHED